MQTASPQFLQAVRHSHTPTVKVEVLHDGKVEAELQPVAGQVTASALDPIRSRCSVTLVDPTGDLTPATVHDLLAPIRCELRVSRGVDGELIRLGVFAITDTDISESAGGVTITCQGLDRADRIIRNILVEPWVRPHDTPAHEAIGELILDRDPDAQLNLATSDTNLAYAVFEGDAWRHCLDMAQQAGMELFVDPEGVYTLRPVPDPDIEPVVWEFHEGEDCTLTQIDRRLNNRETYNRVVVLAQGAGLLQPVIAEAVDDNPFSPTWIGEWDADEGRWMGGSYGIVTKTIRTNGLLSEAAAQDMADAELRKHLGATDLVSGSCIPNPALEVSDVCSVRRGTVKVDARFVLDVLATPLVLGEQQFTMRQRRV